MKKNKIFFELDWKNWSLWVILTALFTQIFVLSAGEPVGKNKEMSDKERLAELESENIRLRKELSRLKPENIQTGRNPETEDAQNPAEDGTFLRNEESQLRKELIETRIRGSVNAEKIKALELSAANILDTLSPSGATERERELAELLKEVLASGMNLAGKSAMASEAVLGKLDSMKFDDVEKAKIRIRMEELQKSAGEFARLNLAPGKPETFETCRILEVNETLGIMVLSAGFRNGVRVNLAMCSGEDQSVRLKVIAVRMFVSAAVLEGGSVKDLAPGMPVRVLREK